MTHGRPWHALQAPAFSMTQVQTSDRGLPPTALRESAFRVFAGCPNLVLDLQTDAVLGVFQRGLQDTRSVQVRHAALLAAVGYFTAADAQQLSRSVALMYPMLETVHSLAQSLSQPSTTTKTVYQQLTQFLTTLTPLCSTHPILFAPHLQDLLAFLPQLILPTVDIGVTPTVSHPFPSNGGSGTRRTLSSFHLPLHQILPHLIQPLTKKLMHVQLCVSPPLNLPSGYLKLVPASFKGYKSVASRLNAGLKSQDR